MAKDNLSGIWQSHYRFTSSSRGGEYEAWHYVLIHHKDNQVIIESLSGVNHSYLMMRLSLDEQILTGTWQETTDPAGYYKGSTYYGAIQAVIRTPEHIDGRWVGVDKERQVQTGPWELTYVGKELPAGAAAPQVAKAN